MSKIQEFQKANGLKPDGIIGKNTLSKMKEVWKIKLDEQLINYLGQVTVESAYFTRSLENTNYSAKRMLEIFKSRFDTNKDRVLSEEEKKKAYSLVGHPDRIANFIYANLNGNGDEASGDGNRYKGASGLQLTSKNNYERFSKWLGLSKTLTAVEVADRYFWEAGLFYFEENKLWALASKIDDVSITKLSKAINLGNPNSKYTPHGLKERIKETKKFAKILGK